MKSSTVFHDMFDHAQTDPRLAISATIRRSSPPEYYYAEDGGGARPRTTAIEGQTDPL